VDLLQSAEQTEALGGVEPRAKEIDHVPFAAQARRLLHHEHLVPAPLHARREREPRDAGADDDHAHRLRR